MRGRRGIPILISAALALGLVASACAEDTPTIQGGGGGGEDAGEGHEEKGTVSIDGEEATNHGSADVTGSSEFQLELDDFYFGPTVLVGEPGQSLSVALHNEGDAQHTFTIDEADVDEELQPGDEDVSVDVTFPDSGTAVFYCSFHRSQGMLGALSVEGDLGAGSGEGEHETEGGDGSSDDSGSGGGGYNY